MQWLFSYTTETYYCVCAVAYEQYKKHGQAYNLLASLKPYTVHADKESKLLRVETPVETGMHTHCFVNDGHPWNIHSCRLHSKRQKLLVQRKKQKEFC